MVFDRLRVADTEAPDHGASPRRTHRTTFLQTLHAQRCPADRCQAISSTSPHAARLPSQHFGTIFCRESCGLRASHQASISPSRAIQHHRVAPSARAQSGTYGRDDASALRLHHQPLRPRLGRDAPHIATHRRRPGVALLLRQLPRPSIARCHRRSPRLAPPSPLPSPYLPRLTFSSKYDANNDCHWGIMKQ